MNNNTVNDVNELREIIANQAIEIHGLKKELASAKSTSDMWFDSYIEHEALKNKLEAKIAELEKQIAEYEGRKAE
jgi:septal ring factor EnvC (AmiA/AmiB activator)